MTAVTHSWETEFWPLLDAVCEGTLTADQQSRLESLVLQQPEARRRYVQYLSLHGVLAWEAAGTISSDAEPVADPLEKELTRWAAVQPQRPLRKNRLQVLVAAVAAVLVLGVGLWWQQPAAGPVPANHQVAEADVQPPAETTPPAENRTAVRPQRRFNAGEVALTTNTGNNGVGEATPAGDGQGADAAVADKGPRTNPGVGQSDPVIIAAVNTTLHKKWEVSQVEPSPRADDAEWLRRVYLDVVGYIPPVADLDRFLADKSSDKRERALERLLDDPSYARNFATMWGNLLVGRSPRSEVNRGALLAFLRQNFAHNRPWPETVYDLITAEGRSDQNGAVNFLVAHLNDGAVPATAISSRLFLGTQLQCVQCHNHPTNDWKQDQFWAFNSFFQQAELRRVEVADSRTGAMRVAAVELVSNSASGPVYFETRSGLMKVAYPRFGQTLVDPGAGTDRRKELARLMTQREGTSLAPAFVNRMWEHFFGRGFTQPVDDMGPHNPPSHPELLDKLSEEFVLNGYDVKRLVRWICLSDAYQRTSRFGSHNSQDDPEAGEMPLFSRVYVKPLNPEQLYDSMRVATRGTWVADAAAMQSSDAQREDWMQQFVQPYGTDENDEASLFDGSITQSLSMMNGDLMEAAIRIAPGTWLYKLLSAHHSETDQVTAMYKAALSRLPTAHELASTKKLIRSAVQPRHGTGVSLEEAYQDLYWAFLNSNEFILNH